MIKELLINSKVSLAYSLVSNQGAALKSCRGLAKSCNNECGPVCMPRRARPEVHICRVAPLAKDYGHSLQDAPCSYALQVTQRYLRIKQRFLNSHLLASLATLVSLAFIGSNAVAQSVTVLGNGAANNCYHAAMQAAQFNITGRDDVEQCTTALEQGRLDLRDRAATYVNRGVVYLHEEEFQLALEDFEAAARLKEDFGEIYVNRGNLYFMGRSFQKAINEYTRALELGLHKEHIAFLNRGMAHENLREIESAEADYRRALEVLPEWSKATRKLEKLLEKYPPS